MPYRIINKKGEFISHYIFDEIASSSEGLFRFKDEDKFGYYCPTKQEVTIAPTYDFAYDFAEQVAVVCNDKGLYSFINKNNDCVIPPIYQDAQYFNHSLCVVKKKGKYGIINHFNEVVAHFVYDDIMSFYCSVTSYRKGKKYGLISNRGEELCPPIYDFIGECQEDLLCIVINNKVGFIDTMGKLVIKPIYQDAKNFSHGVVAVMKKRRWGFIDRNDKWVIPPTYRNVYIGFHEGICFVVNEAGALGAINLWNEVVIPFILYPSLQLPSSYTFASRFINGLSVVAQDKERSEVSSSLSPAEYIKTESLNFYEKIGRNLLGFTIENPVGIIDVNMNIIVDFKYKHIDKFSDGLAKVRTDKNNIGYINMIGEEIIPPSFLGGESFKEGYAVVKTN